MEIPMAIVSILARICHTQVQCSLFDATLCCLLFNQYAIRNDHTKHRNTHIEYELLFPD